MKLDKKNEIINLINLAIKEDKINDDVTSKLSIPKTQKIKMEDTKKVALKKLVINAF